MKKIIYLFLFLIPVASFATIDVNLKYGSRGPEVNELQEFLIDRGFLSGSITGNFFTLTKKAVINYQASIGLPATGFVGPVTRAELNKELSIDTQSEIIETGSTQLPIVTDTNAVLKIQLDSLMAQIATLIAQQKTLADTQKSATDETNQVLNSIKQNTTPTNHNSNSVVVPIDKSEIVIDSTRFLQTNDPQRSPNGEWIIVVRVLNSNGDDEKDTIVKMDAPDDVVNIKEKHIDQMGYVRDAEGNITRTKYSTFFNFAPNSTGDRPITFTSGNLSKTITINVK